MKIYQYSLVVLITLLISLFLIFKDMSDYIAISSLLYNIGSLIFFAITLFYTKKAILSQKRYNLITVLLTVPSEYSVNNLCFVSINFQNCEKTLTNVKVELIGGKIKFFKNYWFKSLKSETDISDVNSLTIQNVFDDDSLTFYLKVDSDYKDTFINTVDAKNSINDFLKITSETVKLELNYFKNNQLPDVEQENNQSN